MGSPKKILVIRFSSIGDIVLTTPVIRVLKQQLGAEIHYLTKAFFGQLLEPNPYVDKVITIQDKVSEVMEQLKAASYDYIVDLHGNLRTTQVKMALRTKGKTFNKINWQKWLMVNWKVNWLPDIHIVDRYLATVKALGVQNDGKGLDYFIPSEDEVTPRTITGSEEPYLALVIGAAHATKRLPESTLTEICRRTTHPVILLGGPTERDQGDRIEMAAGRKVHNTCGDLNLHQSASLVRQALQVITHDTGMMHIAAAFEKEIISVWGNTIPEFGMYPYYPRGMERNQTVQLTGLGCRPCSKIGFQSCPKQHFKCMREIKVEDILEKVK